MFPDGFLASPFLPCVPTHEVLLHKNRRFFWSGSGKDRRARMGNTRGNKEKCSCVFVLAM
jgi:hypothetical protein